MKVIKTYNELYNCLHKYDIFYKSERYKLKIPAWDANENDRISNIINNYSKKCSCNSANFFMIIIVILFAIYYFCKNSIFLTIGIDDFIWLVIYAMFSAVAGKLLGLAYGRRQIIKFIHKLLKDKDSTLYEANF